MNQEDQLIYTPRSPALTDYQRTLLVGEASVGKSNVRTIFYSMALDAADANYGALSTLTLPGPRWAVENALSAKLGAEYRATALETNLRIMHAGAVNAPHSRNAPHRSSNRWRTFEALGVRYFKTNGCRWVNCGFEAWATVRPQDLREPTYMGGEKFSRAKEDIWNFWRHRFWNLNAVWLDFTGCLHPAMELGLSRMPALINDTRGTYCPVLVTVQKGREQRQTTGVLNAFGGDRASYIHFMLDRRPGWTLKSEEPYEYLSQGGVPMLTYIGAYHKLPHDHVQEA